VSIATRGNPALVVDAVRSVLAGAVRPDQVIVVDQSESLDERVSALAHDESVEVIHTRTVGVSVGRNIAIRAATGEVILFTDDDVLVEPHWVEQMIAALERGGPRAVVTGRVLATDEEVPGGRAIALATAPEPAVYRGVQDRDVLSGNSMGFRRSTFDECGLFDERLGPGSRFGSADDNDYGYRVLRAGYEITTCRRQSSTTERAATAASSRRP
jgi:GT2 family glycosyltransferase